MDRTPETLLEAVILRRPGARSGLRRDDALAEWRGLPPDGLRVGLGPGDQEPEDLALQGVQEAVQRSRRHDL